MTSQNPSRNLAARMGRWSARHRKIAIFGWLGFVVVAVADRHRRRHDRAQATRRDSRRVRARDQAHRQGVRAEGERNGARSEHDADGRRPGVPCRGRRRRRHAQSRSRSSATSTRRTRAATASQISPDGRSALVNFEFKSSQQDALKISKPVEDAVAGVQKAHPALTIAEFGDGSSAREVEGQFTKDLDEGGPPVAAGHADHPADHVRRARRRRHSTAAGAHLGDRNDVPDCPAEPSDAGRRAGQRGDPADRARGRRRLLALLSQARTRGTRSRSQRVGCARGRGGDVGTLGAHLRLHRDDRDGGHVLRRRSVVLVVRARHDHGRRDRDAGIAHRAPRACSRSSATGSRRGGCRSSTG